MSSFPSSSSSPLVRGTSTFPFAASLLFLKTKVRRMRAVPRRYIYKYPWRVSVSVRFVNERAGAERRYETYTRKVNAFTSARRVDTKLQSQSKAANELFLRAPRNCNGLKKALNICLFLSRSYLLFIILYYSFINFILLILHQIIH